MLDTQLLADSGTEDQTIYPDSKFVQLLGAHWWRRQLPECRVVAVSPGLIPQTGIARHGSMKLTMDMPDAKTVPEGRFHHRDICADLPLVSLLLTEMTSRRSKHPASIYQGRFPR